MFGCFCDGGERWLAFFSVFLSDTFGVVCRLKCEGFNVFRRLKLKADSVDEVRLFGKLKNHQYFLKYQK